MHIVLLIVIVIAILYGPQLWASRTFRRYSHNRDDIPGTGAELAVHLLKELNMEHVKVEQTEKNGDHYDAKDKVVRLSPKNFNDNSLTAITVAAHEVGHAIQDHRNENTFNANIRLKTAAHTIQRIGGFVLYLLPILAILSRNPIVGLLTIIAGITVMGISVLVNMITLPVEYDASFNKALPMLFEGNYISKKDQPAARRILKAAAFTYVAGSLASLLNLWRWFTLFRR
ncbi:probable metal-dependent peptidase [hydrothermal vent metagenome]|uniref:Probable metal-dependent peptidase n=1 Tax=hydrothermal vent metagenome TaxID=652676 RepID=A0A3B1B032_9ZZZZ